MDALDKPDDKRPIIIDGMFGMGKTTLARDVAKELTEQQRGPVFWLSFKRICKQRDQRDDDAQTKVFEEEVHKQQETLYWHLTGDYLVRGQLSCVPFYCCSHDMLPSICFVLFKLSVSYVQPLLKDLNDVNIGRQMLAAALAVEIVVVLDNVWDSKIINHFELDKVRKAPSDFLAIHNSYPPTLASGVASHCKECFSPYAEYELASLTITNEGLNARQCTALSALSPLSPVGLIQVKLTPQLALWATFCSKDSAFDIAQVKQAITCIFSGDKVCGMDICQAGRHFAARKGANIWQQHVCPKYSAFCVGQVKLVVTSRRPGNPLYGTGCIPVHLGPENSPFKEKANAERLLADHVGPDMIDRISDDLRVSIV
jgi:hypothetical protein